MRGADDDHLRGRQLQPRCEHRQPRPIARRQQVLIQRRITMFHVDVEPLEICGVARLPRTQQCRRLLLRIIVLVENRSQKAASELRRHVGEEPHVRSEEHTSELQSLMRISYAVFCLKKKKYHTNMMKKLN